MNSKNFLVIVLMSSMIFSSCYEVHWELPEQTTAIDSIPRKTQQIEISDLKGLYAQNITINDDPFLDLSSLAGKYVRGYVISSDALGNFYKELFIQDRPMNPSSGLRVLIDQRALSDYYPIGQKVYIALAGLELGFDQGVFTLGIEDGGSLHAFGLNSWPEQRILKDTIIADISPKNIDFDQINTHEMNQWIRLNQVQFHRWLVGSLPLSTFAADPNDQYDGLRIIESCTSSDQVILQTSVYADFQTDKLPQGLGSIQGILQYDYYGTYPVLVINGPGDVQMNEPDRCDPIVISCPAAPSIGVLFERQDFSEIDDFSDLLTLGWTLETNAAEPIWDFGTYAGNQYLYIDGRDQTNDLLDTRLISPEITLPEGYTEMSLELDVQVNYNTGIPLSLYIGQMVGNQRQWTLLDYVLPSGPSNGYGDFETIGPFSLSCLSGPLVLCIEYQQRGPQDQTRYHLDNIEWRLLP